MLPIVHRVMRVGGVAGLLLPCKRLRAERDIIEAALAESRGRVSGPSGAAAKLGIPPTTLDSKIKALEIRKSQYKFQVKLSPQNH
jgi:DNA-binding NtrC family response regulator